MASRAWGPMLTAVVLAAALLLSAPGYSWTVVTVDAAGDVGEGASLLVVNGRPAIAYYDRTNGDLKYVRAADADGSVWGVPLVVASTGDVGVMPELAHRGGVTRPSPTSTSTTTRSATYGRTTPTGRPGARP